MLWREVSPVSCSVLSLQVSCLLSLASMTWPTWPEPRPQCADWTARLLLHCRTLLELRKFKFEPKHFPECNRSNDQHLIWGESPDCALQFKLFSLRCFHGQIDFSLNISLSLQAGTLPGSPQHLKTRPTQEHQHQPPSDSADRRLQDGPGQGRLTVVNI